MCPKVVLCGQEVKAGSRGQESQAPASELPSLPFRSDHKVVEPCSLGEIKEPRLAGAQPFSREAASGPVSLLFVQLPTRLR